MGKRIRHTTNQIILKLREADTLQAGGLDIAQASQRLGFPPRRCTAGGLSLAVSSRRTCGSCAGCRRRTVG
jgi:hypothetical protein